MLMIANKAEALMYRKLYQRSRMWLWFTFRDAWRMDRRVGVWLAEFSIYPFAACGSGQRQPRPSLLLLPCLVPSRSTTMETNAPPTMCPPHQRAGPSLPPNSLDWERGLHRCHAARGCAV